MRHLMHHMYMILSVLCLLIDNHLTISIIVVYHCLYLIQEQSHAVAKPIDAFEDVLVSAGLYDPEDEDSEDMGDFVAKKDNNKKVRRSLVLSFLCQLLCCCDSRL